LAWRRRKPRRRTSSTSKKDLAAVGEPPRDQILDDLLLAVDRDALADQVAEIEMMQRAVEAEEDAGRAHRLASAGARPTPVSQQIGRPLFEHAGAYALLHIGAAAAFEHDRLNAPAVQQMGEHQARGAGAHDATCVRIAASPKKNSHKRGLGGTRRDEARKGWDVPLPACAFGPGGAHGCGDCLCAEALD
jgi:hypothetical protein